MKDLGQFTAYNNRAIKAVFHDRTIVRMMKECQIVRILNRRGYELLYNLKHPNPSIQQEYHDYIKAAQEFYEWVFLSQEE